MTKIYDSDAMRERLEAELKRKGLSMRQASLNAFSTSPGYLHSVIKDGREPTVRKLAETCEANGIGFAYIVLGYEVSPETERLVAVIEQDPLVRDGMLALLDRR